MCGDAESVDERELILKFWFVERIVEAGNAAGGIAKGGMVGDILNSFAVIPHLSAVIELFQNLLARWKVIDGTFS